MLVKAYVYLQVNKNLSFTTLNGASTVGILHIQVGHDTQYEQISRFYIPL